MNDFDVRIGKVTATFRINVDFDEGEDRLCWTLSGLEKLIGLGLWRREFDKRGNLLSKPMSVETAMLLSNRTGVRD
jgi:hypothetical protein